MTNNKKLIIILGSGRLAKDIADLADDIKSFQVEGFVIDQPPFQPGSTLAGKPIFWIDELDDLPKNFLVICGLARMEKINLITKVRAMGFSFTKMIHPSARVSKSATIGEGAVINSGVQIAASVKIGDFVYVNRGSLIGHDTRIGKYSVLSPGVNIAGSVNIGKGSYVGIGAIIIDRTNIGEQCFIGAGSLVTKNVPDHVKVVGVPARIIARGIKPY